MKHYLILIFSTFLISTSVLAQSPPQSFTYQTVIRDNAYNIMANQDITLRISIIEDSPNGTIVYQEKVPVTTSPIGLVNLNIGEGNNPSGDFESIDWANHIFFLEIAADFDNNNNFVVFGTTKLRSVPYALYALNAGNANQGLQGPPGQDGVDGEQGPQGPIGETGPQGEQGLQGPIGETGPQGEQGLQGPIGETGPQGEQGIPGINGLNGDDGIGIINTLDNQDGTFTLVYSDGSLFTTSNFTGQQGIQGPIGETGPQGEQGIQGPTGETGPQGEQGIQGPIGEAGPQGEQGLQGPIGETGAVGPQGPIGLTGPTAVINYDSIASIVANNSSVNQNLYLECVDMGVSEICGGLGLDPSATLSPDPSNLTYVISYETNLVNNYLPKPHWRKFQIHNIDINSGQQLMFRRNGNGGNPSNPQPGNITYLEPEIDANGNVYFYIYAYCNGNCCPNAGCNGQTEIFISIPSAHSLYSYSQGNYCNYSSNYSYNNWEIFYPASGSWKFTGIYFNLSN